MQLGDKVALVGFPSSHARGEIDRAAEVYDPDLLEFRMDTAQVVVGNPELGGHLAEANWTWKQNTAVLLTG